MDHDQLARGAHLVAHELKQTTDLLQLLVGVGARDASAGGWFDALFVHERCLIGFLCGGHAGRWWPGDIKPSDFLGRPWSLPDVDLDRELRGRLPVINKQMAHLTWTAVTDETPVIWSALFVAHQITYARGLFVMALAEAGRAEHWTLAAALATFPPWTARHPQTRLSPAPPGSGN